MKLKLDFEILSDEFFETTRILGIVAPIKDYQFCWQLNQLLRFDFRSNNDLEIQLNKRTRIYYFSIFEFREQNKPLVHYLYNNHFDGEYLLPEFKHLDFLWLLKGDTVSDSVLGELEQSVKTLNSVQLVTELKQEKIKNKAHLIF